MCAFLCCLILYCYFLGTIAYSAITGPVSAKMIINALNCGAKVFMADFEDANSPTWANNVEGQMNLHEAVIGSLEWRSPDGKAYKLNPKVATLMVRPRGWHLVESRIFSVFIL